VKALEKARFQPMYAKVREHCTRPGGKAGEQARDLSLNQRRTLTSLGLPSQFIRRKPRACPERKSNGNLRFLFRFSHTRFRSEGYGLQPVQKCFAMNSALAAEERLHWPAGGNSTFPGAC
jgi:hypothetical protein